MILSFGWTSPALLAGAKTCTRRDWAPSHAAKFKAGMLVDAWNTLPRNVKGNPHKIATIRLTQDAKLELTREAPDSDWFAEGFAYLQGKGLTVDGVQPGFLWRLWREPSTRDRLYVVRFEVVSVEAPR